MDTAIVRSARDGPAGGANQVGANQATPVDALVATREVNSDSAADALDARDSLVVEGSLFASAVAGVVDEGAVDGGLEVVAVDAVAGAGVVDGDGPALAVVAALFPAARLEGAGEGGKGGAESVEEEKRSEEEEDGSAEGCHRD